MTDLVELAKRVEAATGASLVLDRDIALAIYPGALPITGNDARISVWDTNGRTQLTVKPYTASLDAAMTLVPEGFDWQSSSAGNAGVWKMSDNVDDYGGNRFPAPALSASGVAATPALALTAAALRALAAQGEG